MSCQDYKELMMGYLDNELEQQQRKTLENHLASCSQCAGQLEEFKKLKQMTDGVRLAEPEDRIWQQYWANVYNRIERGVGWVIFSLAGIVLVVYGGFKAIEEIIRDPTVELTLKVILLVFLAAIAILFVSILRERLYFWKTDRYKDVRR